MVELNYCLIEFLIQGFANPQALFTEPKHLALI